MNLRILPQPDDATCGPTSLHAVYHYFGHDLPLETVVEDVHYLEEGGTLAVHLGLDALRRGFSARIYSYNLHVFDPTWASLPSGALRERLEAQILHKHDRKLRVATEAYLRFLDMGGELAFEDLTPALLRGYLRRRLPVLTGLSATYLYRTKREYALGPHRTVFDDLRGHPAGHFVVLYGLEGRTVRVADPYKENPLGSHLYEVPLDRLLRAILLGVVTYDANLLIVAPPAGASTA